MTRWNLSSDCCGRCCLSNQSSGSDGSEKLEIEPEPALVMTSFHLRGPVLSSESGVTHSYSGSGLVTSIYGEELQA